MKKLSEMNLAGLEDLTDNELLNKEKLWADIVKEQEKMELKNDEQFEILNWNRSGLIRLDFEIKKRNLRKMESWEKLFA